MDFVFGLLFSNPWVPWLVVAVVALFLYKRFAYLLAFRGPSVDKDAMLGRFLGSGYTEAKLQKQVKRYKQESNFLAAGRLLEEGNRFAEAVEVYLEGEEYMAAAMNLERLGNHDRAAELFLQHRVFRSLRTGEPINKQWLQFHYPPYWHYDVLQALVVLGRLGRLGDPRVDDALDLVVERRRPDGLWEPGGFWWQRPGSKRLVEVVDWGRRGPSEMITLNALRVLRGAGRLAW